MIKMRNLVDRKFHMLQVLRRVELGKRQEDTKWECICDCGHILVCTGHQLENQRKKSCGCQARLQRLINLGKYPRQLTRFKILKLCNKEGQYYWRFTERGSNRHA